MQRYRNIQDPTDADDPRAINMNQGILAISKASLYSDESDEMTASQSRKNGLSKASLPTLPKSELR